MADKKDVATRLGMGFLAVLFLVTSAGLSLFVVWQAKQQNKQEAAQTASLKDAQNNTQEGAMLQGTKLQNFTPVETVTTLEKIDLVEGTGAEVQPGQTVTAHYTGALAADGTIFQSSHDGQNQPIPFSLNGVIKGWTEGVPGMKVGGTRRLIIPADLAYGATPPQGSGIPANAPLVFDIELVAVGE